MDQNYSLTKLYETLLALGKIRHKRDFSRFYLGRKCGYFTMIATGHNRQASVGALQYLVRRLKYEVLSESDRSIKKRLNECLKLAHCELDIRLNQIAFNRNEYTSKPVSHAHTKRWRLVHYANLQAIVVTCSYTLIGRCKSPANSLFFELEKQPYNQSVIDADIRVQGKAIHLFPSPLCAV